MTHKTRHLLWLLACLCVLCIAQVGSPGPLHAATDQPTTEATDSLNLGSGLQLVLFRDAESLTLYVPEKDVVSLSGLTFEAVNAQGKRLKIRLDEFPALRGLDMARIVGPACFQFVSNQRTPLPLGRSLTW